jgi:hypothetical protein
MKPLPAMQAARIDEYSYPVPASHLPINVGFSFPLFRIELTHKLNTITDKQIRVLYWPWAFPCRQYNESGVSPVRSLMACRFFHQLTKEPGRLSVLPLARRRSNQPITSEFFGLITFGQMQWSARLRINLTATTLSDVFRIQIELLGVLLNGKHFQLPCAFHAFTITYIYPSVYTMV